MKGEKQKPFMKSEGFGYVGFNLPGKCLATREIGAIENRLR